jgi:histidinol-phosphate aminotransferase
VLPLYREFDNVILARSFSKDFGMAGLRCGYLLSQPQNIDFLYRVKPMYEVSQAAVAFCLALLEHPRHIEQYVAEVRKGLKFLKEELQRMGIVTGGGYGNFLVVYLGDDFDIPAMIRGLKSRDVLVRRPFQVEAIKGWLRIAAGNESQMQLLAAVFREVLKETGWSPAGRKEMIEGLPR